VWVNVGIGLARVRRMITARPPVFALLSLLAIACGSPSSDAGGTQEGDSTSAVAFTDASSVKHITLNGMQVDLYETSAGLKGSFDALTSAFPSNGYAGFAAKVSAADLQAFQADPNKLVHFVDLASQWSPTEDTTASTDEITVSLVSTRGTKLVRKMGSALSQNSKSAAFKKVSASILADGVSAVYDASWCPDWCDEAEIVVTPSGEIRAIVAFGDN
jgi:hypothetical protein